MKPHQWVKTALNLFWTSKTTASSQRANASPARSNHSHS
ncbi:MAG: hypothetical protein ACJAWK_001824, partial [Candidatus Azotimanducaceae bacterium]